MGTVLTIVIDRADSDERHELAVASGTSILRAAHRGGVDRGLVGRFDGDR